MTNKMIRLAVLVLALLECLATGQETTECVDINSPPIRTFKSITAYQKNTVSFNPLDDNFQGNYIKFGPITINHLDKDIFQTSGSNFIRELYLNEKSVTDIEDEAFTGLQCLAFLDLHGNDISKLEAFTFKGLIRLTKLDLSQNSLRELPAYRFSMLTHLRTLNLSNNLLEVLSNDSFTKLPVLQHLYLNNNNLQTIPTSVFSQVPNVIELDLASNKLFEFTLKEVNYLHQLYSLVLTNNSLNTIDIDTPFTLLAKLFLAKNNISSLDIYKLKKNAPHLLFIDLNSNSWNCNDLTIVLQSLNSSHILYKGIGATSDNIDGVQCSDSNPSGTSNDCISPNKNNELSILLESNENVMETLNTLHSWVVLLFVVVSLFALFEVLLRTGCINNFRNRRRGAGILDNSNVEDVALLRGRW